MDLGGYTAAGPRETNEDNYYSVDFSDIGSFSNGVISFALVSDGMGGYQNGDVASSLVVANAEKYIGSLLEMADGHQVELDAPAALGEIVQNANEAVLAGIEARGHSSMGATFVGAFVSQTHAWIGHVGDSRAYLIRNGKAEQLTVDHSQVGRMLSQGLITEEEAQSHPSRNKIEQALGFTNSGPEIDEVDLAPGDALLLCSDGVSTALNSEALASCIVGAPDSAKAAERVVKAALKKGTDDNATAVVMFPAAGKEPASAMPGTQVMAPVPGAPDHNVSRARRTSARPVGGEHYRPAHSRPASSRARASSRRAVRTQRPRTSRSPLTIAVPVVVLALLAGLGIGLFLGAGNTNPQPVEGTGQQAGQTSGQASSAPSTSASQDRSASTSQSSSQNSNTSATKKGYRTYTVAQGAELKYVDSDNLAQLFEDSQLGLESSVQLKAGSIVTAKAKSGSYSREKTYYPLDESYLDDLKQDISSCRNGATSFDSSLSGLVKKKSYLSFVQELAEVDEETLDGTVTKLVVETPYLTATDQSASSDE